MSVWWFVGTVGCVLLSFSQALSELASIAGEEKNESCRATKCREVQKLQSIACIEL